MVTSNLCSSVTLGNLFSNEVSKLSIPVYQRPYTWGKDRNHPWAPVDQVDILLKDLYEKYSNDKEREHGYLLGTIVLCENEGILEVVDGQQRLVTLTLLFLALGEKNAGLINQNFSHEQSKTNIKQNFDIINGWLYKKRLRESDDFKLFLKEKIFFVKVIAPTPDDAFIFFDSQNSRGKPLSKIDLLKAHHLRYIDSPKLQENCNRFWVKLDRDEAQRLPYILETMLGRLRLYTRKHYGDLDALEEFRSQRLTSKEKTHFTLNNYQQPPIFQGWQHFDNDEKLELIAKPITMDGFSGSASLRISKDAKLYIPFQITQKLEGGAQFFWYVEKYCLLYDALFEGGSSANNSYFGSDVAVDVDPFERFKRLWASLNKMQNPGIRFILDVFKSVMLFYYDKFGRDFIFDVAVSMEHLLFYLRLKQSPVQYRSIGKFIREEFNPFVLINDAAFPEYIVDKISDYIEGKYSVINLDYENLKGVRKDVVIALYGEDGFYRCSKDYLSDINMDIRREKEDMLSKFNGGV